MKTNIYKTNFSNNWVLVFSPCHPFMSFKSFSFILKQECASVRPSVRPSVCSNQLTAKHRPSRHLGPILPDPKFIWGGYRLGFNLISQRALELGAFF